MNAPVPSTFRVVAPLRRPEQREAFALVITLLILSLLIIIAVSFLASTSSERQTANAYTSKALAEQIAQAAVDSAVATMTESFRDFPDSATAWDPQQSVNTDTSYNEGTNLYLRAMPTPAPALTTNPPPGETPPSVVADPNPPNSSAANAAGGNNPGNPGCKNFVLPLISGVPLGRAQLISAKSAGGMLPTMNVSETDPTLQNFTDLNVRRFAGDTQGIIGSPPAALTTNPAAVPTPKPARALWVNLTKPALDASGKAIVDGKTGKPVGLITGRYAYWIEDESFRANNSYLNDGTNPPDNSARATPTPSASAQPTPTPPYRSLQPGDLTLVGPLTRAADQNPTGDATSIRTARAGYPGNFFPDPLAFGHVFSSSAPTAGPSPTDVVRYLTTNQSGTLNLTRHGTQRLNLNYEAQASGTLQTQINHLTQALKFHLPYFGQRFYRLTTDVKPATLNNNAQVPGGPRTSPDSIPVDNSEIYFYKVAANLHDYVDADTQPTIIDPGGILHSPGKPVTALNGGGSLTNDVWAVGKEAAPYLQEAAIRMRPVVSPTADSSGGHPFDLQVDYYLEFWNMTDRDIYASPQSDGTLPHLNGATIRVTNQNVWETQTNSPTTSYGPVQCSDGSYRLSDGGPELDYEIDLTTGVHLNGSKNPVVTGGVVFKAGAATVITTDPDCASYVIRGPHGQSGPVTTAGPAATNPLTTYYCSNLTEGQRHYTGVIPKAFKGFEPKLRDQNYAYDYETEVTLCNASGYLDSVPFAIDEHGYTSTWYSDTTIDYHDYTYTSCLMGNYLDAALHFGVLPSQLGDPRTNNEQLNIKPYVSGGNADQSHYIYGNGADASLGYYNPSQKPDLLSGSSGYPWPDYYVLPAPEYPAVGATANPMNNVSAPMVVADTPLTSIGQLGDVFDPARLPGTPGMISLSRGGGRTFKIGQRDDRYCGDPTGNNTTTTPDSIPNSNGWASWRLADVFSIDDPIELPARININGVLRDQGAALLSALLGFTFQPATNSTDPVIHGDNHSGASSPAGAALVSTGTSYGFSQLIAQIKTRLQTTMPPSLNGNNTFYTPSGPFFERGEIGEIGTPNGALFGMSDPMATSRGDGTTPLISGVNMYQAFDHSREEIFRRISEMICTRGDTFTAYVVGQSIQQSPVPNSPLKVTGTHRMRVTFRLVPKVSNTQDYHPSYKVDPNTGALTPIAFGDLITENRFLKPDHYDAQILSVSTY